MIIRGIAWLLYNQFNNVFANNLQNYDGTQFNWAKNLFNTYQEANYGNILIDVARGYAGFIGLLPTPIIYLMSIGFTLLLVGIIVRIVIDLL